MKTIGLIGGMSWESTIPYYRQINQTVKEHLGGLHSAKLVLYSVDFHEVERLQHAGDWEAAGALMAQAASIEAAVSIPLLVGPQNATVPLFDTTAIHARAAAQAALAPAGAANPGASV